MDKEKYLIQYINLQNYLRRELKQEKVHHVLESDQWKRLKPYIKFNIQKIIESEKNWGKMESILQINK